MAGFTYEASIYKFLGTCGITLPLFLYINHCLALEI